MKAIDIFGVKSLHIEGNKIELTYYNEEVEKTVFTLESSESSWPCWPTELDRILLDDLSELFKDAPHNDCFIYYRPQ